MPVLLLPWLQVHKEDPAASYSRVRSIETSAEGAADGCWDTMMGPACVLNPTSVSCISAAVAAPGEQLQGLNTIKQLGAGLQQQLAEGKVVCSRDLPFFFSVASQEDYEITKAFFAHYTKLQGMAAREVSTKACAAKHLACNCKQHMPRVQRLSVEQSTGHKAGA